APPGSRTWFPGTGWAFPSRRRRPSWRPGAGGRRRAGSGAGRWRPRSWRVLLAEHPLGAALLEAGGGWPHPLRVADDLHVVDGQLELLGHLADHLGGADPGAGPLDVARHTPRRRTSV